MVFWMVSPVVEASWLAKNQLLQFAQTGYKPWLLAPYLGIIARLLA